MKKISNFTLRNSHLEAYLNDSELFIGPRQIRALKLKTFFEYNLHANAKPSLLRIQFIYNVFTNIYLPKLGNFILLEPLNAPTHTHTQTHTHTHTNIQTHTHTQTHKHTHTHKHTNTHTHTHFVGQLLIQLLRIYFVLYA